MIPLLLLACAPSDPAAAMFLGASFVTRSALGSVGGAVATGEDPAALTTLQSSRYGGPLPVDVTYEGPVDDLCAGCTGGVWTLAVTLDDVRILGDAYAEADDAAFDCDMGMGDCDSAFDFTPPPFTLSGALALRAAVVFRGDDSFTTAVDGGTVEAADLRVGDDAASVTVAARVGWDDYSEDIEVSGTVDGAAYGYDVHSTD